MAAGPLRDTYAGYRERLVEKLRIKGISDLSVLEAVAQTPRHLFVPEALRSQAYEDTSLPIGSGQTISQPSTHAMYLQTLCLTGKERVLEVGTGTGYQTALLARLADVVISIERVGDLARRAREVLEGMGIGNVTVITGDGSLGRRSLGPYDRILVAAAGPAVPKPLIEQLAENGRMVIPLERDGRQELYQLLRSKNEVIETHLGSAQFVPLIGKHGFEGDQT